MHDPSEVVPAAWAPVQVPFSSLRPGLAEAERRLNAEPGVRCSPRWERLHQAVGDEHACLCAVNDLLATVLTGWHIAVDPAGRSRIWLLPTPGADTAELAAVQALVLLVEAGGWSRLGRCAHPGCAGVFLDVTSGANRRSCRAHQRNR